METKISLPPKDLRKIYWIAIAFSGENRYLLKTGEFGPGFVHVVDEESTFTVVDELDTLPDFINYLKAKKYFVKNKTILVVYL